MYNRYFVSYVICLFMIAVTKVGCNVFFMNILEVIILIELIYTALYFSIFIWNLSGLNTFLICAHAASSELASYSWERGSRRCFTRWARNSQQDCSVECNGQSNVLRSSGKSESFFQHYYSDWWLINALEDMIFFGVSLILLWQFVKKSCAQFLFIYWFHLFSSCVKIERNFILYKLLLLFRYFLLLLLCGHVLCILGSTVQRPSQFCQKHRLHIASYQNQWYAADMLLRLLPIFVITLSQILPVI